LSDATSTEVSSQNSDEVSGSKAEKRKYQDIWKSEIPVTTLCIVMFAERQARIFNTLKCNNDNLLRKIRLSRLNFFFSVTNSVLPAISGPAFLQTSQCITSLLENKLSLLHFKVLHLFLPQVKQAM
jgi:hypothetical protein